MCWKSRVRRKTKVIESNSQYWNNLLVQLQIENFKNSLNKMSDYEDYEDMKEKFSDGGSDYGEDIKNPSPSSSKAKGVKKTIGKKKEGSGAKNSKGWTKLKAQNLQPKP